MMKIYKKILSLCLVIAIVVSSTINGAFAAIVTEDLRNSSVNVSVINEDPSNYVELIAEDLANGDVVFTLSQNGIEIDSYYVDRENAEITSTKNSNAVVVPRVEITQNPALLASTPIYTYMGAIEYQFSDLSYISQTGMALVWNAVTTDYSATYNINGTYQNIATLAAFLATIFSFPGAIINAIAQYVVWAVGATGTVASIVIPNLYLSAIKVTSLWRAANSNTPSSYIYDQGAEYTITAQGYEGRTYADDSFHDPLEFNSRNGALATDIFAMVWPGYIFGQVLGWYIV